MKTTVVNEGRSTGNPRLNPCQISCKLLQDLCINLSRDFNIDFRDSLIQRLNHVSFFYH
jgi:hypothetical protein